MGRGTQTSQERPMKSKSTIEKEIKRVEEKIRNAQRAMDSAKEIKNDNTVRFHRRRLKNLTDIQGALKWVLEDPTKDQRRQNENKSR